MENNLHTLVERRIWRFASADGSRVARRPFSVRRGFIDAARGVARRRGKWFCALASALALTAPAGDWTADWQESSAGFVPKKLHDLQTVPHIVGEKLGGRENSALIRASWQGALSWLVSGETPPRLMKTTVVEAGRDYAARYGNVNFTKQKALFASYIDFGAIAPEDFRSGAPVVASSDWSHTRLLFGPAHAPSMELTLSRLSPALLARFRQRAIRIFDDATDYFPEAMAFAQFDEPEIHHLSLDPVKLDELPEPVEWILVWQGAKSGFWNGTLNRDMSFIHGWRGRFGLGNNDWRDHIAYKADCPVLIVFGNPPASVRRDTNGALLVEFKENAGYTAIMPLFDFEFPPAEKTAKWIDAPASDPTSQSQAAAGGLPGEVFDRCVEWAERLLQYPVSVRETWSTDEASDTVAIQNKFTFQPMRGDKDGKRFAPIPPMLAVAADAGFQIETDAATSDTGLLSYCGPYTGIPDADGYVMRIRGTGRYWREARLVGPSTGREPETSLSQELAALSDGVAENGPFAPWSPFLGVHGSSPVDTLWMDPADQIYYPLQFIDALDKEHQNRLSAYARRVRDELPPEDIMLLPWNMETRRERARSSYEPGGVLHDRHKDAHRLAGPARRNIAPLERVYTMELYYRKAAPDEFDKNWIRTRDLLRPYLDFQDWATAWRFIHPNESVPQHLRAGMPTFLDTFRSMGEVNAAIAGLIGLARMSERAGDRQTCGLAQYLLAKRLALRFAMDKYTAFLITRGLVKLEPYQGDLHEYQWYYKGQGKEDDPRVVAALDETGLVLSLFAAGNWARAAWLEPFQRLTPELARFLGDHCREESKRIVDYVETISPHCYAAYHRASIGTLHDHNNLDRPEVGYGMFLARAWILESGVDFLATPEVIDYPRLQHADWFHMSKLAEAIKSARGWTWTPVAGTR